MHCPQRHGRVVGPQVTHKICHQGHFDPWHPPETQADGLDEFWYLETISGEPYWREERFHVANILAHKVARDGFSNIARIIHERQTRAWDAPHHVLS